MISHGFLPFCTDIAFLGRASPINSLIDKDHMTQNAQETSQGVLVGHRDGLV